MNRVWIILFALFAGVALPVTLLNSQSAMATEPKNSKIFVASAVLNSDGTPELAITLQTRESVSGNCDLVIRRFEYVRPLQALMVQADAPAFCAIDRVGRRSGYLKWALPAELAAVASLDMIVNDEKVGVIRWNRGDEQSTSVRF